MGRTIALDPVEHLARETAIREMCVDFLDQIEEKYNIKTDTQEAEDAVICCAQFFIKLVPRDVRVYHLNLMLFRELSAIKG